MKKIWILIIASVMILGILSFFVFQNKESEIYTYSYDEEDTFLLGSFLVIDLSVNGDDHYSDPLTTFYFSDVDKEDEFMSSILASEFYQGLTSFLYPNNYNYTFYLLENEGYQYILYKDRLDRYVFQPLYSKYEFISEEDEYSFRFPCPLFMYFNNNTNVSNDHDLSLNEFIDFYENFNLDLVEINYENYSVRIKGYSIYENIISEAYVIELTYSDESLTATYISDSNE